MALIQCEECGQMVSDKASTCPHCGAPVKKKSEASVATEDFWTKAKKKQEAWIDETKLDGYGKFRGICYKHILKDGRKNLFEGIRERALKYFENKIEWWNVGYEPTGNVLSSQVACINHLFALRNDADAVLKMINGIMINGIKFNGKDIFFAKVIDIPSAYDVKEKEKNQDIEAYIAFEVVNKNNHLNEGSTCTRGANCTSIDALIYAQDTKGKKWIIPIEWKYTEKFSSKKQPEKKIKNYIGLIDCKSNLKEASISNYIQETYYQLMRQTLWAEQVVKNKDIEACDFLHIHVIPNENEAFRKNGKTEKTWKSKLNNPNKYIVIDPQELFKPIMEDDKLSKKYSDLIDYLNCRYWM